MTAPAPRTERDRLRQLQELLGRHASALDLDKGTLRSPRPGALAVRTVDGDLVMIEIHQYPRGQW